MKRRVALLRALADGRFVSGEDLAGQFGLTRTAIWKQVRGLREWGVDVHAVRGRGYRLASPLELLDGAAIRAHLGEHGQRCLGGLEIHPNLESTNRYLLDRAKAGAASGSVCLAEWQSAGRGRRGRVWQSPFGRNICLSVLWRFHSAPHGMEGLGLAMGVAIVRTLSGLGVPDVRLKWPNDIHWQARKLAGVLVELTAEGGGPCAVVVGIGLNVNMSPEAGGVIDQPWVDLAGILRRPVSRNEVAGRLINEVLVGLAQFAQAGLQPFLESWRNFDLLRNNIVRVTLPSGTIEGLASGIDDNGALLVRVGDDTIRMLSGEVSVRLEG